MDGVPENRAGVPASNMRSVYSDFCRTAANRRTTVSVVPQTGGTARATGHGNPPRGWASHPIRTVDQVK